MPTDSDMRVNFPIPPNSSKIQIKGTLNERLIWFLSEILSAKSCDKFDIGAHKKIDFITCNGLICIEIKSLQGKPENRAQDYFEKLTESREIPLFFGSLKGEKLLDLANRPYQARRGLIDKIGRPLKDHMRNANQQFASHIERNKKKNQICVLIFTNEYGHVISPEMASGIMEKHISSKDDGGLRFNCIDAIFFLSDRASKDPEGNIILKTPGVLSPRTYDEYWKIPILEKLGVAISYVLNTPDAHEAFKKTS